MPYRRNADLPGPVRHVLPAAAQTIFRKAFNSADAQYGDESRARRVAWAAVKRKYRKSSTGAWKRSR